MDTTSHKILGVQKLFEGVMPKPVDPTNLWFEEDKILKYMKEQLINELIREKYASIALEYKESVQEHAELVLSGINRND